MRGEKKYEKLNEAHDEWMKQQKTGEGYQPGIAVAIALAKKNLPNPADRNPKGTPKEKWRCIYYPRFCGALGHKDARSKECGMNAKSKAEREAAKKSMLAEAVAEEMTENRNQGMSKKERFFDNFS